MISSPAMSKVRAATLFATRTLAMSLFSLLATCGGDGPFECHKPIDCATAPNATTCKQVGGHGRCVIDCAAVNGQDNCPVTYHCGGTADDQTTFCTPVGSP
jgi:predicted small lipoprotein YifL